MAGGEVRALFDRQGLMGLATLHLTGNRVAGELNAADQVMLGLYPFRA